MSVFHARPILFAPALTHRRCTAWVSQDLGWKGYLLSVCVCVRVSPNYSIRWLIRNWQNRPGPSVLFEHQGIFRPDWGRKRNGFTRSIKLQPVWLGSCPTHNTLRTVKAVCSEGVLRGSEGAFSCVFSSLLSRAESWGEIISEGERSRGYTSYWKGFRWPWVCVRQV